MALDYARATGAPRTVTLAGRDYRVHKIRPRDLGELEAWFKDVTPDPRVEARKFMEGLPDAVAKHMWDRALEDARGWPPRLDSDAGSDLMSTPEGQARSLWLILRRGLPGMTLDEARDLADAISREDYEEVIALARPGDPGDPKPMAPAESPSAETPTPKAD
jgi:hypothetical protein